MPYTLNELQDIAAALSVLDEDELDYVFEGHARVNRRKNLMKFSKKPSAKERYVRRQGKMSMKDLAPHDRMAIRGL